MAETNQQILKRLLNLNKSTISHDIYAIHDIQLTEIVVQGNKHYLPYNNPVTVYSSININ